jgi:AraC-like DNA-binding protein
VHALAGAAGISERHARRRFLRAVGYGLKSFQRIARLRRLREWAALPGLGSRPLAQVAYDLGYADQAHLTREITALAGMSPATFIRVAPNIQIISDHVRLLAWPKSSRQRGDRSLA